MNNQIKTAMQTLKELVNNSTSTVFFGGAGVSTESGIPDFRSQRGRFQAKSYGYPVEEILSHSFFFAQPKAFYDYYFNEMIHVDAKPNAAHLALAVLEEQGHMSRIITQNIDGLHQRAGSKLVSELHGSVHRNTCMICQEKYSLPQLLKVRDERGIPLCSCGAIIKPDVVLYEEPLEDRITGEAIQAIANADVLIVAGTSLQVYPAAGFLSYYPGKKLIILNQEETPFDARAHLVFREPVAQVFKQLLAED